MLIRNEEEREENKMAKIYTDYFLDEEDFDKNHFHYKKLSVPDGVEAKPLAVPPVLKPDKVSGNDVWYTIESIESKVQLLPGKATKTWGYNAPLLGVFMYHCHIIEHEDAGMMAQIEIFDPYHPKKYHLMDMETLTKAFAEEKGIKPEDVWMPGMDTEGCGMDDATTGASQK